MTEQSLFTALIEAAKNSGDNIAIIILTACSILYFAVKRLIKILNNNFQIITDKINNISAQQDQNICVLQDLLKHLEKLDHHEKKIERERFITDLISELKKQKEPL